MNKLVFSTFEIAKLCNVDMTTVINWIDKGMLPAYKTPGGHRRVNREDLIEFLKKYNQPAVGEMDSNLRILIIDDDENMLEILKILTAKLDAAVDVMVARDGFDAGKKIIEWKPDLLIVDLVIPGIDGFQIIKNVRQDKKLSNLKIVVVTAYDTYDNKVKISKLDTDGYFVKPFKTDEVRKKLNKILFH